MVLVAIIVIRLLSLSVDQRHFDLDPAVAPDAIGGAGLSMRLRLSSATMLASAVVLWGLAGIGRAIRWPWVIAAFLPAALSLVVRGHDAANLVLAFDWTSAVVGAMALSGASADPWRRRRIWGALALALIPLAMRGAAQIEIPLLGYQGTEYAATVEEFDENRDAILQEKGWSPDSSSARIFERRLRQAQPTGWFISTNVFGTIAAAGSAAACALLAGAWSRMNGAARLVVGAGAVILGAGVVLTDSKGALLSWAAALAAGVCAARASKMRAILASRRGVIMALVPAAALAGVVVRGAVLDEGFAGDRSLLFRWFYAQAAVGIVADHPLAGAGAAGFQEAFLAHRPARCPEEVASAHNVVLDWIAAFGAPGTLWVLIWFVMLARCARAAAEREPDPAPRRGGEFAWIAVPVVAMIVALGLESGTLDAASLPYRIAGLALAIVLARPLRDAMDACDAAVLGGAAIAVAVTIALHGMIEMTLTQANACGWCLALLASGGPVPRAAPRTGSWRRIDGFVAMAAASLFCVVIARFSLSAARAEAHVSRAAEALAPLAEGRVLIDEWKRAGATPPWNQRAAMVIQSLGLGAPSSQAPVTGPQLVEVLRESERDLRLRALSFLRDAGGEWPRLLWVRLAEAKQSELYQRTLRREDRPVVLAAAARAVDDPRLPLGHRSFAYLLYRELARLSDSTGDEFGAASRALELARELAARDPNGLILRKRLAETLETAGLAEEARTEWRRVLEIDAAYELDPLKRLTDAERNDARRRAGL